MSDIGSRVAQPGDPDLDADIDGLTVYELEVTGREILLHLMGGFGRWRDVGTGEMVDVAPGEPPASEPTIVHATIGLPTMPDGEFAAYVAQLERWRDTSAPLRLCCAPGKVSTLIEDRDRFLFIPRD